MKITLTHQTYKIYSDGMQLSLPLDLPISIHKDDPMWSFLDAVEGAIGVIKQDFNEVMYKI